MTKKIQAFFKNESEAESALAKLQKLNVSHAFVDTISDDLDVSALIPVPSYGAGGTPTGGVTGFVNPGNLKGLINVGNDGADQRLTSVLEFEVEEENVQEALSELRDTNAYIDKRLSEGFNN